MKSTASSPVTVLMSWRTLKNAENRDSKGFDDYTRYALGLDLCRCAMYNSLEQKSSVDDLGALLQDSRMTT